MKQETNINLRMANNLNNNSVMIPSILNDSKKQEQSSLEKGKEKILRINWIDRRQPLTKHIVEWIYDESVKEALADQKAKIREWLRKQNEVSDGFLLDFDEEFKELRL